MSKVEKELHYLKNKATDQETRLAQDDRILKLQKQLEWFKDELDRLNANKETNYQVIEEVGGKVKDLRGEKQHLEEMVKAQKRQNKLLIVALNKTQNQKE